MCASLNKCATCKWFGRDYDISANGTADCGFINTIQATANPATYVDIKATASDDQGLSAILMVGPGFGCLHHTPKQKKGKEAPYYIVNFSTWNAGVQQNIQRNFAPLELSATIDTVNTLIDGNYKDITIDELAPGMKTVAGRVVKRWRASELLVANCATYPIQGADPDAY
jgi:hypothetical protein